MKIARNRKTQKSRIKAYKDAIAIFKRIKNRSEFENDEINALNHDLVAFYHIAVCYYMLGKIDDAYINVNSSFRKNFTLIEEHGYEPKFNDTLKIFYALCTQKMAGKKSGQTDMITNCPLFEDAELDFALFIKGFELLGIISN